MPRPAPRALRLFPGLRGRLHRLRHRRFYGVSDAMLKRTEEHGHEAGESCLRSLWAQLGPTDRAHLLRLLARSTPDPKEAERFLAESWEVMPNAQTARDRARLANRRGELASAVRWIDEWLAREPESGLPDKERLWIATARGWLALRTGRLEQCLPSLGAELEPRERAHLLRSLLGGTEEPQQVEQLLAESWRAAPSARTARELARLTYRRGDLASSVRWIDAWLAQQPESELSERWRAWIAGVRGWAALGTTQSEPGERRQPAHAPAAGRVLHCLHNSFPAFSGGNAVRAHGLLVGLRSAGYDVLACTRPGFPQDRANLPELISEEGGSADKDVVDGIAYHRLSGPADLNTPDAYLTASIEPWKKFMEETEPAVVQAASTFLTALPALRAARSLGIPTVYEVRGFYEVTRVSLDPRWAGSEQERVIRRLEALTADLSDRVITLSGTMRNELIDRGIPADKIWVAPNAVDPAHFVPRPPDEELKRQLGWGPMPVIGYVGYFADYQGLGDLVRAARLLVERGHEFRLLLVGSGPSADRLSQEIEELGLGHLTSMPGRVPHDDVPRYYSLVDIAPLPRPPMPVAEVVSPIKPLEAMAMEKAVVVSGVAALAEMVEHGRTGLVHEKGSVPALADALEQLLLDEPLRRSLAKTAHAWVRDNRSWQQAARTVARCYESLGVYPAGR